VQLLTGGAINRGEIWACLACGACSQECPVLNDPLRMILDFRRALVWEGDLDTRLGVTLNSARLHGNTAGRARTQRADWTQGLPFSIRDARIHPVEYLWFVGDNAAFDPDLAPITRLTAELFNAAGLDFGILFDGEDSDGNDIRRVGEEGLFSLLVKRNLQALSQCNFQAVVTTDPHAYNTLKNEYPPEALNGKPLLHYSELLELLLSRGKLSVKKPLSSRVTYHDPCYLGRLNAVYESPRRVLQALGCTVVEMESNRARSLCCGAGGGRIWMEEGEMKQRPSDRRIEQALTLDQVDTLVVACPKDWLMYSDAGKDRIAVKDLAELVAQAVL
jgi:Fe-S oxidoreductase